MGHVHPFSIIMLVYWGYQNLFQDNIAIRGVKETSWLTCYRHLPGVGKMQPGVTLRDLVHAIPYYAIQQAGPGG